MYIKSSYGHIEQPEKPILHVSLGLVPQLLSPASQPASQLVTAITLLLHFLFLFIHTDSVVALLSDGALIELFISCQASLCFDVMGAAYSSGSELESGPILLSWISA